MRIKILFFLFFSFIISNISSSDEKKKQQCDIKTTLIKIIDTNGKLVEEKTEEKVVCDDSAKHFLEEVGVAKECRPYVWLMPLGGKLVEQRSIACEKLDGSYEIIPAYTID